LQKKYTFQPSKPKHYEPKSQLGKGTFKLRKSRSLVGLKSKEEKSLAKTKYVKEQVLPQLGGFEVVKTGTRPQHFTGQKAGRSETQARRRSGISCLSR
jgi:hypothetical protein